MAPTTKTASETTVTIDCPRCAGQGGSKHWHPDAGVCYLCYGRGDLAVNIERGERHLSVLRREYVEARRAGDEELMALLVRKGSGKRALVEAAKEVAGL